MSTFETVRSRQERAHPDGRPTCYGCKRPSSHCLCSEIEPFDAHCNVLILQHPRERKKYYATAPLVVKTLKNSRLVQGIEFQVKELEQLIGTRTPYLLFPGKEALDCRTVSLGANSVLIVIDGTWSEAGKLVHRNPLLLSLPRVSFSEKILSNYRIRKQPKPGCLSTLESLGHFLQMNAQSKGMESYHQLYPRLFKIFDRMVEQQLHFLPGPART